VSDVETDEDLTAPLLDDAFYRGDPFPHYARLRAEAPVAWNRQHGFWVLSRHADVMAASADPATFCSSKGILVQEIGVEYASPPTIMHTDPPAHTRYRKLVQPGFGPRQTRELDGAVRERAQLLIDALPAGNPVEVVSALTAILPLQVIIDLLGVDDDDYDRFLLWSDAAVPGTGEMTDDERMGHMGDMVMFLLGKAGERRADPRDDLVSTLATVELDGDRLSDDEVAMFLVQLLVAGNETSRNMLTGGLHALAQHPDQWAALRADRSLIPGAVEEMLRWTTPVISFMRTATRDVEIRGTLVRAGDPTLLLYAAANRDEDEFGPTAERFDITRSPNHHVAFGFGAHFCIGAALARLEARAVLDGLLDRFEEVEPVGAPVRSGSGIIAGIRRADLRFVAA